MLSLSGSDAARSRRADSVHAGTSATASRSSPPTPTTTEMDANVVAQT